MSELPTSTGRAPSPLLNASLVQRLFKLEATYFFRFSFPFRPILRRLLPQTWLANRIRMRRLPVCLSRACANRGHGPLKRPSWYVCCPLSRAGRWQVLT